MQQINIHTVCIAALIFLCVSCGSKDRQTAEVNTPEEIEEQKATVSDLADVEFIDGMTGKAFHNYLQLSRALFNSDLSEAHKVSGNLAETFSTEREEIRNLALEIAASEDLEDARKSFSEITDSLEPLFRDALTSGTIYKQFCPMAFENEGAYWISNVEEIKNPYFGEAMPHCGSTEEKIAK